MQAYFIAAILALLTITLSSCGGSTEESPSASSSSSSSGSTSSSGECHGSESIAANDALLRLTRSEYVLTVRDLLGVANVPTQQLVQDRQGTFGESSVTSEAHIQKYQLIAEAMAEEYVAAGFDCQLTNAVCNQGLIADLVERAFRMPADAETLEGYQQLFDLVTAELDANEGMRAVVEALLQSPKFLYRVESTAATGLAESVAQPFIVANRLSYMLTGRQPDAALYANAKDGSLLDEGQLQAHAERLMATPESEERIIQGFFADWLDLDHAVERDDIAPALAKQMQQAALDFIAQAVTGPDGSIARLLTLDAADFNAAVSEALGDTTAPRPGIFSQPGWLAQFTGGDGAALIGRGVFISEELLCITPPPPPDVVDFPEGSEDLPTGEWLRVHREADACSTCHALFDPLGLAFDSYDQAGRYRTESRGYPVQTADSFELGGRVIEFENAAELMQALSQSPELYECAAGKWLEYALRAEAAHAGEASCTAQELGETLAGPGGIRRMLMKTILDPSFIQTVN